MKIGIIVAMEVEFRQLVRLMEDARVEQRRGLSFTVGRIGSHDVVLMKCGIGKVNAAMGSTLLIDEFQPSCVISTGCAGGIDARLNIRDVVVSAELSYHDVDCGVGLGCTLGQVQGLPARFPAAQRYVEVALALNDKPESSGQTGSAGQSGNSGLSRQSGQTGQSGNSGIFASSVSTFRPTIHAGLILTGDQFITSPEALAVIKSNFPEGLAVDMESAAIAQVCYLQGVPFVSFRVISDTPGAEGHQQQYDGFWEQLADRSFSVTRDFLLRITEQ